jgi:hypothetical protein
MINRDCERSLQTIGQFHGEDLRTILLALLEKHHLHLAVVDIVQGGLQISLAEGPKLTIYRTARVLLQGRRQELARAFRNELEAAIIEMMHRQSITALWQGDPG